MKQPIHPQESLLGFLYGELSPADARRVEAHVNGCPQCSAELRAMKGVRRAMAPLGEAPAPSSGLDSLLAYAQQQAKRAGPVPAPVRRSWTAWGVPAIAGAALVLLIVLASRPRRPNAGLQESSTDVALAPTAKSAAPRPSAPAASAPVPTARAPVAQAPAPAEDRAFAKPPPPMVAMNEGLEAHKAQAKKRRRAQELLERRSDLEGEPPTSGAVEDQFDREVAAAPEPSPPPVAASAPAPAAAEPPPELGQAEPPAARPASRPAAPSRKAAPAPGRANGFDVPPMAAPAARAMESGPSPAPAPGPDAQIPTLEARVRATSGLQQAYYLSLLCHLPPPLRPEARSACERILRDYPQSTYAVGARQVLDANPAPADPPPSAP